MPLVQLMSYMFSFIRDCWVFFKVVQQFYMPKLICRSSAVLNSHQNLSVFFNFSRHIVVTLFTLVFAWSQIMLSISLCVCWPLLYLPLWTVCSSILPILKICAFKIIIELWEFYLFYPGDKSLDQCAINLFFHCKACLWILWVVSIKEIKEQEFKIFMKSKLLFLCFQYFCTLSKKYLPIPKDKCFLCIFPIGFILLVFLFRSTTAPHSRTLAWKILWTEEPGRLQSMGSQRVWHDWASSLSLSTFMHWRRKWHHTPVFLPGESPGRGSLVGCRLWGRTESDTTEAT